MSNQRYLAIMLSVAAVLAVASLPSPASATELPVPTRAVEKPRATPVVRPVVHVSRKPVRYARRWYTPAHYVSRPVRYLSRPIAPAVQYAALERRWSPIFLGVGF